MNPFNERLDWTLQGKQARVHTSHHLYTGWIDHVHHGRGSVIIHDAEVQDRLESSELSEPYPIGSAFIRSPTQVETVRPRKQIEYLPVDNVLDSQFHDRDVEPTDHHMRRLYRNQFAGSYPVVRPLGRDMGETTQYELINGHKRVAAMRAVGLDKHPFEVFECDDEVAEQLYELAHRSQREEMLGGEDDDTA